MPFTHHFLSRGEWCRVHYPPFVEEMESQDHMEPGVPTQARARMALTGPGPPILPRGSTGTMAPTWGSLLASLSRVWSGIWWGIRMYSRGHETTRRALGWAWPSTHFFLTWQGASYRYYFVLYFFCLSVCPGNLSISVHGDPHRSFSQLPSTLVCGCTMVSSTTLPGLSPIFCNHKQRCNESPCAHVFLYW